MTRTRTITTRPLTITLALTAASLAGCVSNVGGARDYDVTIATVSPEIVPADGAGRKPALATVSIEE